MKNKQKNFQSIYKQALKECGLPNIINKQECLIISKSYENPKIVKKSLPSQYLQQLQAGHNRNFSSDRTKSKNLSKNNILQKKYSFNNLKSSHGFGRLASIHLLSEQTSKINTLNLDEKLIKISTQASLSARQNQKNKQLKEKLALLQHYSSNQMKNKKVLINNLKGKVKQWQKQQFQDINDFVQFVDSNKGRESKHLFYQKY